MFDSVRYLITRSIQIVFACFDLTMNIFIFPSVLLFRVRGVVDVKSIVQRCRIINDVSHERNE